MTIQPVKSEIPVLSNDPGSTTKPKGNLGTILPNQIYMIRQRKIELNGLCCI